MSQSVSDPIPLPWDASGWVRVRKLSGREYEDACDQHRGSIASGRARGWPALFRRALEKGATDPDVLKTIADPLSGHDRYALLVGVVDWSYTDTPIAVPEKGDALLLAAAERARKTYLDDQDDEAVEFYATEVLRRTKPGLFQATAADAATEKKSG